MRSMRLGSLLGVKGAIEAAMAWMVAPQGSDRYQELANEMIRLNVENLRFFVASYALKLAVSYDAA